ncbi:MAG: HEAT repeat domain-containing protein [Paludisphaera borealis]|uniref:HEAT repeat domain-containing protein n=1 Tax=Paludisphaera borealis TaxID=1387353 RepID=UPI00284C9BB4|nr:HEAT repeat domain-containing protein [Paludisphaera borealis]MDR3618537.1 HEAT repeat domain-containing protein [Paludisphaera borealis]
MDEGILRTRANRRAIARLSVVLVACAAGCTTYVGTTARSFLGHVRNNPDPNVRYVAYSKLGSKDLYDNSEQKSEAVATLIEKYERGKEPVAIRAVICRSLGDLGDPSARTVLLRAVHDQEAVIKIEACRALGKVGRSEDATVLAQIMTLDHLEDARIAAIEGLADLKSRDPRIYKVLLDAMEHEDPAIRLASVGALRKLTGKDEGTEVAAWRRAVEPIIAQATTDAAADPATASATATPAKPPTDPSTKPAAGLRLFAPRPPR